MTPLEACQRISEIWDELPQYTDDWHADPNLMESALIRISAIVDKALKHDA